MKLLRQFSIILLFSFLGEIVYLFLPLPIPASVCGLLITLLTTVIVMAVTGRVTQRLIRKEREKTTEDLKNKDLKK